MIIDINLPFFDNETSPSKVDEAAFTRLISVVKRDANKYLRSRPKVTPYQLGSTNGRIVSFNFSVFSPGSKQVDDSVCLKALLYGLAEANGIYMQCGCFPELYSSGVFYKRTKVWDSIIGLINRGYGDCKTLTAVRLAEMWRTGYHAVPNFRWERRENGGKNYHILIDSELGYEDPSKILGMGMDENVHFRQG